MASTHHRHAALRSKLFIAVMLFLTFVWTGSMAWLALIVTLLIASYAYLSRQEVGRTWVALPLSIAGYWILVLFIAMLN